MLDQIKSFFHSAMSPSAGPTEDDPKQDMRLAACALLLELAHADDEFTPDEGLHLKSAVRRQYGVDSVNAERLIELAEQARADATDLWQFTGLIKENYSLGQKMVLAEIMWGLLYADGELTSKEDYLMRRICSLLDLEPGYLAQARRRVEGAEPID